MEHVDVRVYETIPEARPLRDDEVRVLFQRHVQHENNSPDPKAIDRIFEQGELLGPLGFQPTLSRSSSSPRALWSNLVLMSGIFNALKKLGQTFRIPNVPTEPALDAFGSQADDELKQRVTDYKSDSDLKGDDVYWQFLNEDSEFCSEVRRRGHWAATAIMKLVKKFQGQTILATSHGVAVMESAITHLSVFGLGKPPADDPIRDPEQKVACGQIVELIFCDRRLIEVNFFPAP